MYCWEWSIKDNFSAAILKLANQLDISIESWKWNKIFLWSHHSETIKSNLSTKDYKQAIPSLRNNRLMFTDQLLTLKQNRIRDWRLIQLYQFKKRAYGVRFIELAAPSGDDAAIAS